VSQALSHDEPVEELINSIKQVQALGVQVTVITPIPILSDPNFNRRGSLLIPKDQPLYSISEKALDLIVEQLDQRFESLNTMVGKLGSALGESEFLNSLKSRTAIPGGTCEFDLPAYHAWQHHEPAARQANLYEWSQHFAPLASAIQLMLKMMRESGSTQKVMATGGQLQQNLPQGRNFQLLRLRIDDSLNLTPEISCNRLLVVIRLMQQQEDGKLIGSKDDTPFEMTLCA
jgi:cell division protein ZapD